MAFKGMPCLAPVQASSIWLKGVVRGRSWLYPDFEGMEVPETLALSGPVSNWRVALRSRSHYIQL